MAGNNFHLCQRIKHPCHQLGDGGKYGPQYGFKTLTMKQNHTFRNFNYVWIEVLRLPDVSFIISILKGSRFLCQLPPLGMLSCLFVLRSYGRTFRDSRWGCSKTNSRRSGQKKQIAENHTFFFTNMFFTKKKHLALLLK